MTLKMPQRVQPVEWADLAQDPCPFGPASRGSEGYPVVSQMAIDVCLWILNLTLGIQSEQAQKSIYFQHNSGLAESLHTDCIDYTDVP